MRIRHVVVCAAAITVGAGLATPVVAGPSEPAGKLPVCRGHALHTTLGRLDAGAGSYYQNIKFSNTGKRCVVRGWPKIRYVAKAHPVSRFAKHRDSAPHRLVLRHGHTGVVTLQTPNPHNYPHKKCDAKRATRIATYIPAHVRPAAHHRNKLRHPMRVCSGKVGRARVSRMRHAH